MTADIEDLRSEVERLCRVLDSASELPPAVLYILYRFSDSALEAIEETRQRWSSEHGIEGWRTRFGRMLDWRSRIGDLVNQLGTAYEMNPSVKKDILGAADNREAEIQSDLENAALGVLNSLDAAYPSVIDHCP